jgi:hypothetical protein
MSVFDGIGFGSLKGYVLKVLELSFTDTGACAGSR